MVLDPTERAATYMVTLGDSVGYSLIYPTIMDKFGFRMRQKKLNWVVDSGECADAK